MVNLDDRNEANGANGRTSVIIKESAKVDKNMTARFAVSKDFDPSKAQLVKETQIAAAAAGAAAGKTSVVIKGNATVGTNLTADTLFF